MLLLAVEDNSVWGWLTAATIPALAIAFGLFKKVTAALKLAKLNETRLNETKANTRKRENIKLRRMKREMEETSLRIMEYRNEELTQVRERMAAIEGREKMIKDQLSENLAKVSQLTSDNAILQGKIDRQDETIRLQATRIKAQQEEIEKLRADLKTWEPNDSSVHQGRRQGS